MFLNIVIYFLHHFNHLQIFFLVSGKSSPVKSSPWKKLSKKLTPRKNAAPRKKYPHPKKIMFSFIFLVMKEGGGKARVDGQNKFY